MLIPEQLNMILANQAKQIALGSAIATQLGAGPSPASGLRVNKARQVGGGVQVTFTWDPASDGVTTGYVLSRYRPDGELLPPPDTLGQVTSFRVTMPDDTATYAAALVATSDAGLVSDPVTTTFEPHTEPPPPPPPPPPQRPAAPTGFVATVGEVPPVPQQSPFADWSNKFQGGESAAPIGQRGLALNPADIAAMLADLADLLGRLRSLFGGQ